MLSIIDNINNRNIVTEDSILVGFDIVNMFPSIDNVLGSEAVSEILDNRESDFPPAECILDTLKVCLECNNSVFKACVSSFLTNFYFSPNDCPSKTMKDVFNFI